MKLSERGYLEVSLCALMSKPDDKDEGSCERKEIPLENGKSQNYSSLQRIWKFQLILHTLNFLQLNGFFFYLSSTK